MLKKRKIDIKTNLMLCPNEIFYIIFDFMYMEHLKKIQSLNKEIFKLLGRKSNYWNIRHGIKESRTIRYMKRTLLEIPSTDEVYKMVVYRSRNSDLYKEGYNILLQCINKCIQHKIINYYIHITSGTSPSNPLIVWYNTNSEIIRIQYTKEELRTMFDIFTKFKFNKTVSNILANDIRNLGFLTEIEVERTHVKLVIEILKNIK